MDEINGFRNIKKKTVIKRIYSQDGTINKSFVTSIYKYGESGMLIEQTEFNEDGEIEHHGKDEEEEYFRKRKEQNTKDKDDDLFMWDGRKEEIVDSIFGKTKLNYEYDGPRIKATNIEYLDGKILGRDHPKLKDKIDREEYSYDEKGKPTMIKKISWEGNIKTTKMLWDDQTEKLKSRSEEENGKLRNLEEFFYNEDDEKERKTTTHFYDEQSTKSEFIYNSEGQVIEDLHYENDILTTKTIREYSPNLENCIYRDLLFKYIDNNLIIAEELIYEYEFHKLPLKKFI